MAAPSSAGCGATGFTDRELVGMRVTFMGESSQQRRSRLNLSAFLILDWREQVEEATPERRAFVERAWPVALEHVREMRDG
jgi:hypothetical protein